MDAAMAMAQILRTQQAFRVIAALLLTSYLFPRSADISENCRFKWDFIVVGAGTAGAVIADRLSEGGHFRVLVIDAGGDPPIESTIPSLYLYLRRTSYDWNFTSGFEDTKDCKSKQKSNLTCGRVLGGSSSLNSMYYVRGVPEDYMHWAAAAKDDTWSWDGVFSYFLKSERLESGVLLASPYAKYHGTSGFLGITREDRPDARKLLASFGELHDVLMDINGDKNKGYTLPLFTIADGIRQSTAYTNLGANKKRFNLKVLKNTLVTEILFDDNNNAIGVKAMTTDEREIVFKAKKEIIVSAGAFNSPKLLMLSGIGPREHLRTLNIKVRSNLPIGQNYHNHPLVYLSLKMEKSQAPVFPTDPYSYHTFAGISGFVALKKDQNYPDYQTVTSLVPHDSQGPLKTCVFDYSFKEEICQNLYEAGIGTNTLFITLTLLHPKSRGRITLQSTNPLEPPRICFGTFSNEEDLETLVRSLEDYIQIVNTTYFKSVNAKIVDLKLKECVDFAFGSRDYWRCYTRTLTTTMHHYSGTCSLGSVVDSRLRVFNVNRLRIADASVIPRIISGNTYAPVIMIGEKAADMIKQDHRRC